MNKFYSNCIPLLFAIACTGCLRKELPVPAHDPGNVTTTGVSMESDYRWQIYYSLRDNKAVGRNLKTAWDLGFEPTADGWHIILNGAKAMYAMPLSGTDLASISKSDTAGFEAKKKWDASSGNLDSTAIGDWRANDGIYVIDRGYDELGRSLGFAKIRIQTVDDKSFSLTCATLNAAAVRQITIKKDSAYNFTFFNLDSVETCMVEPPKKDWDIVFTQYTHTFHQPSFQPYLVTGCLHNRYGTLAAIADTSRSFEMINYSHIASHTFSTAINTIGYEWKIYTGSTYVTDAKRTYLIRDASGIYYKLHFVDFLSSAGVKGNPRWEFQRL